MWRRRLAPFALLLAASVATCTRSGNDVASSPVAANSAVPAPLQSAAPAPPAPPAIVTPPIGEGVTVRLDKLADGPTLSFGVPVPKGLVTDASAVRVRVAGAPLEGANVKAILREHDKAGAPLGVRAIVVQFPSSAMKGTHLEVEVRWKGDGPAPGTTIVPFATTSHAADELVDAVNRTITSSGGTNRLVDGARTSLKLFAGRLPNALATFPEGYLAATQILGAQVTAAQATATDVAGMTFLSQALPRFAASAMFIESYAVEKAAVVDPSEFEQWLYDRCTTFLTAYTHTGDVRFLRHGLKTCAYYSSKITLTGANAGIFTGKPDPDSKYSHVRGVYAYYAMTGDESALAAGTAMANLWLNDAIFVAPYAAGKMRGDDKLWTERLLGTALEGLYYGHRLTGDPKYLVKLRALFETAYKHITGDAAALKAINPYNAFPPQNCFIHNAAQHGEGNIPEPWCSGWMSELVIDPLLRYQEQTGDDRVDEVFVRLARFLRDVGSAYFDANPIDDTFFAPKVCYDPTQGENVRRLVPLYGSALRVDKSRHNQGEFSDFEHCPDATALTAAALRGLRRQAKLAANGPIGQFATEADSFIALHQEFAVCARLVFESWPRKMRDPNNWTSEALAPGLANPAKFITDNKIGWPSSETGPRRKLSWWFNTSMLQFGLLRDAGVSMPIIKAGHVKKTGCP